MMLLLESDCALLMDPSAGVKAYRLLCCQYHLLLHRVTPLHASALLETGSTGLLRQVIHAGA